MTPEKVTHIIEMYEQRLRANHIGKKRIDPRRTFASLSKKEMLEHAHFLCDGAKALCKDPEKQRKTGSHLTAIQMCLSFAG